ncbi:hypothetical protein C8R47DRAFT_1220415 [Mycena vitilis]|nr:hypothetical protein C8R47DRAFT_1220415 [Mycena vitilis]
MFTNVLLVAVFASTPLLSAAAPAAVDSATVAASVTIPTCGSLTVPAIGAIAGAASAALNGLTTDTMAAGNTVSGLVDKVVGIAGSNVAGTLGTVGGALGSIGSTAGGAVSTLAAQTQTAISNIVNPATTNIVAPAIDDLSTTARQLNGLLSNLASGVVSGADGDKLFAAIQALLVQSTTAIGSISKFVDYLQSATSRAALKSTLQNLQSNVSPLFSAVSSQCSATQKQTIEAAATKALTALSALITKCG